MKSFKGYFQLPFAPSEISELAARYRVDEDREPLQAGRRVAEGGYTRANLDVIFKWKARGRGKSRLEHNTALEIDNALRLAVKAKTERAATAVLRGLDGVDVAVASAILTAINPERYTVIDFRALESLGYKAPIPLLAFT